MSGEPEPIVDDETAPGRSSDARRFHRASTALHRAYVCARTGERAEAVLLMRAVMGVMDDWIEASLGEEQRG